MHRYPPVRRRRQGKLFAGVLLAVVAVAGVGYLLYQDLAGGSGRETARTETTSPTTYRIADPAAEAAPGTRRTDTILSCTAPDGSRFYTNAPRCEDADLDNRVNVTPAVSASREAFRPEPSRCLGAQAGGARAHAFLSSCQEPFNQALALEPRLLEAEDPLRSRTLGRYCDLVTEGVQSGCMATSAQFCFLPLCQELRVPDGS